LCLAPCEQMRRKDGPSSRAGRPWSFGPGLTKGAAVIDSARAFSGRTFLYFYSSREDMIAPWIWGKSHMRIFIPAALVACVFATGFASADVDRMKCSDFAVLPAPQQKLFVDGMVNGMGMTFGVLDTMRNLLEVRAASDDEQKGVDKLRAMTEGFMSQGHLSDSDAIVKGVVAKCAASPDSFAANVFLDVMSGR